MSVDVDHESADTQDEQREVADQSGRRKIWRRRAAVALVLAAVAAGAFGWARVSLDRAEAGPQRQQALARDKVLVAATEAVETLNTLDHRQVGAGLDAWQSVTTGALHDQLARVSARDRKDLARAGRVSTARVVDAAVLELDAPAGTASAMAFVEVTVTADGSEPVVKRHRYVADLERVDGAWLVAGVSPAEVSS